MTITRNLAVVALAFALSACAMGWVKPGASEQDLAADQATCEREADAEFAMGSRLKQLTVAVDKRGAYDRCMIAHGWRDKNGRVASTESRTATRNEPPLYLPGYSR